MSVDNRYSIIFNGEIFNYKEIKRKLIERKYKFYSNINTEVALNAFIEWGEECFDLFNGDWIICILDKLQRTFIIAKDEITLSYIPDPVKWSSAYHNGFLDILHTYQPYGFPIVLLVIIAYITLLYKIKGSSLSKNSGNLNSHLIFLYSSSFILFFTQVIPNASYIFALVPYLLTRILLLKK